MQMTISRRYCGPATSGNGGWTAGSLAEAVRSATGVGGPISVRLTAPPPLDRPLDIELGSADEADDGAPPPLAVLSDRGAEVATASLSPGWSHDPVPFVEPDRAAATASSYVTEQHPFPHCFVCGPARSPGDGMRLTPGPLGEDASACLWRPADTHDGAVTEPAVWAALDCPGGWASDILGRPMVLGTMTAQVLQPVGSHGRHVVTGRVDAVRGRVTRTSSTLWSARGELLARAEAAWVEVDAGVFDRILS